MNSFEIRDEPSNSLNPNFMASNDHIPILSPTSTENERVLNVKPPPGFNGEYLRSGKCLCDPKFVYFCKINCVHHEECPQLLCDLCDYKAEVRNMQMHFNSVIHQERHQAFLEHAMLIWMPVPVKQHISKISDQLEFNADDCGLARNHLATRERLVSNLNHTLYKQISDMATTCQLRIYGSSINGFGLRHSNINLELIFKRDISLEEITSEELAYRARFLSRIADALDQNPHFISVIREFNSKMPRLHFTENKIRLNCELSIWSEKSYLTSRLLGFYNSLDDRVRILGLALRKWARDSDFDDQEGGTWPSHAFAILVIHFLQRVNPPVLPCLHAIYEQLNPGEEDKVEPDVEKLCEALRCCNWRCGNQMEVGLLWILLLKYYAIDFSLEQDVVSIRHLGKPETHKDKKWGTKLLAIEDPCRPTLNLSRSVGSMKIYHTFVNQLRNLYKYFAVPMYVVEGRKVPLFKSEDFLVLADQFETYNRNMPELARERKQSESSSETKKEDDESGEDSDEEKQRRDEGIARAKRLLKKYAITLQLQSPEKLQLLKSLRKEYLYYTFDFRKIPMFQRPARFCRSCHKHNHCQSNCPLERLPPLVLLPDFMPEDQRVILDRICWEIFEYKKLTVDEESIHSIIINDLETYVEALYPDAQLELFGSSKNGFGAQKCDLDICITFKSNETGEGLNFGEIIESLAAHLKNHNCIKSFPVIPIPSAKVPIVKFSYLLTDVQYECDISLYNILARYNTKLLRTYCDIDHRVAKLGFIVKHFAKVCDIGDASRGSLSSYAYTLMTLHFLQQKNIIPVLQEIGLDHFKSRVIDTWETWFFDDLKELNKHWQNRNTESVGELFLDFLRYYSEIFRFDEHIICCRQKAFLTRLDKMWTGKKIAIEDPFLLSHNLGAGVDDQMAAYIKTAIIKCRNLIGSPPYDLPPRYKSWREFFFDRKLLTHGDPPTGRGCRVCGKIGHKMKECPIELEKKKKRKNNKSRKM